MSDSPTNPLLPPLRALPPPPVTESKEDTTGVFSQFNSPAPTVARGDIPSTGADFRQPDVDDLIAECLISDGRMIPIPKIRFLPDWTFKTFCIQNSQAGKANTAMAFGILKSARVPFKPEDPDITEPQEIEITSTELNHILNASQRWMIDLVACYQVSPLNESNYINYFKMNQSDILPWKIHEIIKVIAGSMPIFSEAAGYSALSSSSTFMTYHTNATSTPALMRRAVNALPLEGLFTPDEISALQNAEANPTSIQHARAIPVRALMVTSAILKASGILPDSWYMGAKAVAEFPPGRYNAIVSAVSAASRVLFSTSELSTTNDIDVILDCLSKNCGTEVTQIMPEEIDEEV